VTIADFLLFCLGPLVYFLQHFILFDFPIFRCWWRLFQKRVLRAKLKYKFLLLNCIIRVMKQMLKFTTRERLSVTCVRSVVFSGFSGFRHQYNWPTRYNWNIVESGVKYHNSNPSPLHVSAPKDQVIKWVYQWTYWNVLVSFKSDIISLSNLIVFLQFIGYGI
jgi:hypothetical protein